MNKIKKEYLKFIKFVLFLVIIFGIYYLGYGVGSKNIDFNVKNAKIINIDKNKSNEVDFSIFWDAWNIIKSKFIEKNLDYQKMVYGAISGMLKSLSDPYTSFMTPEESKMFGEDMNGSFGGIGVEIEPKDGVLIIIAPLDGSPAKEAGIRSKDLILKIDGVDIEEFTYIEAINKIRGEKGSKVKLTILHETDNEPVDIEIVRDTIKIDSVKWEIKDNDVMYLRISQFGDDTLEMINKAAEEMQTKNIRKIIIDVRDNPGGYLAQCVDITSLFIPEGVVVYEQDRNGNKTALETTLIPRLKDAKKIVLINGGSASASEILAGAIQDSGQGVLIGEKSFGKGSVQTIEKLEDGSQVKITIAKWLTPKERIIDKEGIVPDIEVKLTKEDIENENDLQLQKAIEEINK